MLPEPQKSEFIRKQLEIIIPAYDEYIMQDFESPEEEAEYLRVKLSDVCFVAKEIKKYSGV